MKLRYLIFVFLLLLPFVSAGLNDGLVSYYPLDNNSDQIGSFDLTTSLGSPTYSTGIIGNAVTSTPRGSGIAVVGTSPLSYLDVVDDFSIALWANVTNLTGNADNYKNILQLYANSGSSNARPVNMVFITDGVEKPRVDYLDTTILGNHTLQSNTWYHFVFKREGNYGLIYINGELSANQSVTTTSYSYSHHWLSLLCGYSGGACFSAYATEGQIDEVYIYNRSISEEEIDELYGLSTLPVDVVPGISGINCTSCNIPYGDTVAPYETDDTTPTFKFDTNVSTFCKISNENLAFESMTNNCTEIDNINHTCTLPVADELLYPTSYVYVSCANMYNYSLTTNVSLLMNITNLEVNATKMLQRGIESSSVWPDVTVYTDQQVFLRNAQNDQLLATVDKVLAYGSQRWLLNYNENGSSLGLFNITPTVYSLDLVNSPLDEIESIVSDFIDSTKQ